MRGLFWINLAIIGVFTDGILINKNNFYFHMLHFSACALLINYVAIKMLKEEK